MATLEELKVVINAELKPFQQKMKEMENTVTQSTNNVRNKLSGLRDMFSGLAKVVALGLLARELYQLGKYSVQTALEVQASMNQIQRLMGESSQAFLKWAENNALAFNMSKAEAIKYGSTYGNILAGFISNQDKLAGYTAKLLETSSIIAQGTGRTMTDVMERIRSGLLGNTEAIEDLGVMVNVSMIESTEAFKKFANGQSWQQLDFQTQQQIRLMAILEQATKRYGDTLQDNVNNRISTFKALMKDSALNIGNMFLPIINAIMPILNAFASVVRTATAKLAEFIQLLFDKKVSSTDGVAGAVNNATQGLQGAGNAAGDLADNLDDAGGGAGNLADNVGKAGKAAKKAVKELRGLMGFDEINLLNKKNDGSDDNSGGGGGKGKGKGAGGKDILPDIAISDRGTQYNTMFDGLLEKLKPLLAFLEHLKNLFSLGWKLTFREEGIEQLKKSLMGIKESLEIIFGDGLVARTAGTFLERLAFALGQTTAALANVVLGIAVFIAESLNKSLQETRLDIKSWLMRSFLEMGDIVASIGNIAADISNIFYDIITSKPSTDIGANIISTLTYATMGVVDVGLKLGRDMYSGIEQTLSENKGKITQAYIGILEALRPISESIKDFVKDGFAIFNKVYDEHIKPFIDSFWKGFSKITGILYDSFNNYINPVLKKLGDRFQNTYQNYIKPAMESVGNLLGTVFDILKKLWENVLVPFLSFLADNVFPVIAPIIERIGTFFLTSIQMIISKFKLIVDVITGVLKILEGIFSGDWAKIWEGVKDIFVGVWDFIIGVISTVWEQIKTVVETGFDIVKAVIKIILDAIVLYFTIAFNSVTGVWALIVSFFQGLWDGIVTIFSVVGTWFTERFKEAWDGLTNIFKIIGQWFNERWTEVKNILSPIGQWFKDKFQNAWNNLTNIFIVLGSWFGARWNDVTNALSNVASWFGNIFTSAYNAVKNAFSSIGSFFSGVWATVRSIFVNAGQMVGSAVGGAFRGAVNAVLGTIENIVNGFISMINGVISVINELPGVSVGYLGGISLPRLARGGIVDSPTIAMIGEAGKEAVVPLENTGFLQTMGRVVSSAVADVIGNNQPTSGGLSGDIVIQLGGTEYARFTIDEINKEQERVGQTLIKI
jgi:TMP repeat-containing protein|nr:MAG TPA: minor tail protein [Caudoviricetes sp.]